MNKNINLDATSDGKNYTPRNLGLPESKHLGKTDWPSIYQLTNKNKRETIPVAFRIDEVAFASLDLLAEKCDISISALVNEILNSYIAANQDSIDPANNLTDRVLELSLERLMSKMLRMDKKRLEEFAHDLTDVEFTSGSGINYGHSPSLGKATFVYRPDVKEAWVECFTEFTDCSDGQFNPGDYYVAVPGEKWPIVGSIIASYGPKVAQFRNINESGNSFRYDSIEKIINENDGRNLIIRLISELRAYSHIRPSLRKDKKDN